MLFAHITLHFSTYVFVLRKIKKIQLPLVTLKLASSIITKETQRSWNYNTNALWFLLYCTIIRSYYSSIVIYTGHENKQLWP